MKNIFSIMTVMLLVTAAAVTGFAGNFNPQQDGPVTKPQRPEPPEKEPYEYIKLDCKVTSNGVQPAVSLNEASKYSYFAEAINKTGKTIPTGAVVEYNFKSNTAGYFQTAQGGKSILAGTVVLKAPLAVNGKLFLSSAVFVTTKNPTVTCTAFYKKKK